MSIDELWNQQAVIISALQPYLPTPARRPSAMSAAQDAIEEAQQSDRATVIGGFAGTFDLVRSFIVALVTIPVVDAGKPIAASGEMTFSGTDGGYSVDLRWNATGIGLTWDTDPNAPAPQFALFVVPHADETKAIVALPGRHGERFLLRDELGFDPTSKVWAVAFARLPDAPG